MQTMDFGWKGCVNVDSFLNKCATTVGGVDSRCGYAFVGTGGI